jgi:hypothetical protein
MSGISFRHIDRRGPSRLRRRQQSSGLAEKFCGLAGFCEDAYGAGKLAGLFAYAFEVGVKTGEHNDAAGRLFLCHVAQKRESISAGHGDIAEQQMRVELSSKREPLISGVGSSSVKAALAEYQRECIGNQTVIVDDQNALHCGLLVIRSKRRGH